MKLDLSRTNSQTLPAMEHVLDMGDMRPSHPVLDVDRAEVDTGADSNAMGRLTEVLHIRVHDGDKIANFHVSLVVVKGRPILDIFANGKSFSTARRKKVTGVWRPKVSS